MDLTTYDYAAFIDSYLETALWASIDEEGDPLDMFELSPEAKEELIRNALGFLSTPRVLSLTIGREEEAGHDFFLTAAGHGAGFWDGDWDDEAGEYLTKCSKPYNAELYLGDDELVYVA